MVFSLCFQHTKANLNQFSHRRTKCLHFGFSCCQQPSSLLWKVMNEHVRNNVYFYSKAEFTSAIKKFFDVMLPEVEWVYQGFTT
ncbi:hypothetical protein B9J95_15870 [Vibrio sp. V14_P6S14T42]|nr:hypothetical protein B9J95_15870 [Vibrio sp. V14_P6S14T42]